jgi:Fe-Mn family superoxide dismutase
MLRCHLAKLHRGKAPATSALAKGLDGAGLIRYKSAFAEKRRSAMLTSRRYLILGTAAMAAVTCVPRIGAAQAVPGPFHLDPLPYPTNALEPHIDAKTMEIHHDRHHQAYVNNLNVALKDYPAVGVMPLPEILARLREMPESIRTAVRNNAGGHANHSMFWQVMGPDGGAPAGDLLAAIDQDLGGSDTMQSRFNDAGVRVFGSGWALVSVTRDGTLAIETRPNQDTPLMDGKRVLFGNDVWEHAYYLTYQNRRADYLKAWWNTVNWNKIAERYAAAKAGTLGI